MFIIILIILIILVLVKLRYNNSGDVYSDYIYLDNNATTRAAPGSVEIYAKTRNVGNPNSFYNEKLLKNEEAVKSRVISVLFGPDLINENYVCIINSGATEGNCNVYDSFIRSRGHVIISNCEHYNSIAYIKKQEKYTILEYPYTPESINSALIANTGKKLLSIMAINNETGEDFRYLFNNITTPGDDVYTHSDVTQLFGKAHMKPRVDFATGSFHKIGGPAGIGFIVCSPRGYKILSEYPLFPGKSDAVRAGTINYSALMLSDNAMLKYRYALMYILSLRNTIINELNSSGIPVINSVPFNMQENSPASAIIPANIPPGKFYIINITPETQLTESNTNFSGSIPGTLLISVIRSGDPITNTKDNKPCHFCNVVLRKYLYNHGVIVSIGSACSGKTPSHVLQAMKLPFLVRCGILRISLAQFNTILDVRTFVRLMIAGIHEQSPETAGRTVS